MTYSPLQLLMSRIARTKILILQELLLPAVASEAKQQLAQQQKRQKQNSDKSTKPLPPLEIVGNVHLRQGSIWIPATASGLASAPRSYIITTTDGQQCHKNRRDDLLKTNIPSTVSTDQTEIDDEEDYPTTIPEQPVLNPQNPPDVRRSLRTTAISRKCRDYVMK